MSHAVTGWSGRETPRWSVAGQNVGLAASMAGLPASRAIVCVGPPLLARAARFGLAWMSKPQLVPTSMLCPAATTDPPDEVEQFWGVDPTVLPETIEFWIVIGASSMSRPPALALCVAELPTIVTCVSVPDEPVAGWKKIAPPKPEWPPALFPLKVLLVMSSALAPAAGLKKIPPPNPPWVLLPAAAFELNVLPVTLSVPPVEGSKSIAPPNPPPLVVPLCEMFEANVLLTMFSVPVVPGWTEIAPPNPPWPGPLSAATFEVNELFVIVSLALPAGLTQIAPPKPPELVVSAVNESLVSVSDAPVSLIAPPNTSLPPPVTAIPDSVTEFALMSNMRSPSPVIVVPPAPAPAPTIVTLAVMCRSPVVPSSGPVGVIVRV